jgi:hypothetical protein
MLRKVQGFAMVAGLLVAQAGCSGKADPLAAARPETAIEAGFATHAYLTPETFHDVFETFTDSYPVRTVVDPGGATRTVTGDGYFSGCPDEPAGPAAGKPWCAEAFDDRNGNGWFDGAWLAGFGSSRAATGALDPQVAAAWALRAGGRLLGFATIDAVGIHASEVEKMRQALWARGLRFDTLIISATHSHESPDTMGQWGPDASRDIDLPLHTGAGSPWLERVRGAVVAALASAVGRLEPAALCTARASSAVNPLFDAMPPQIERNVVYRMGGGTLDFPDAPDGLAFLVEGLENDWRDPFFVAHELPVLQFRRADGSVIGTVANLHSHPESLWSDNRLASADYPHWVREGLRAHFGGEAVHVSGSVGGIIGPHDVPVWLRSVDGRRQWGPLVDPDLGPITDGTAAALPVTGPLVAHNGTVDKARSLGWAYADLLAAAIGDARCHERASVASSDFDFRMPVHNPVFVLAGFLGLFPRSFEDAAGRPLPGIGADVLRATGLYPTEPLGWVRTRVGAARLRFAGGDELTLVSAPGEMFSEQVFGLPDDLEDPTQIHRYWPQGRNRHAADYRVAFTLQDMLFGGRSPVQRHDWFLFGLGNDELGYLVPASDFIRYHPLFDDEPADHYEESNSAGPDVEAVLHGVYRRVATDLAR